MKVTILKRSLSNLPIKGSHVKKKILYGQLGRKMKISYMNTVQDLL